MKTFQEYLSLRVVHKQRPNPERAEALIAEAEKKRIFMLKVIEKLSPEEIEPNFTVENCYDILMELIRAAMFLEGYNSQNSHEAEVSYLRIINFSEADTLFMDELRYFRNGIKYYGRILEKEYATKVLQFHNRLYPQLLLKLKPKPATN